MRTAVLRRPRTDPPTQAGSATTSWRATETPTAACTWFRQCAPTAAASCPGTTGSSPGTASATDLASPQPAMSSRGRPTSRCAGSGSPNEPPPEAPGPDGVSCTARVPHHFHDRSSMCSSLSIYILSFLLDSPSLCLPTPPAQGVRWLGKKKKEKKIFFFFYLLSGS